MAIKLFVFMFAKTIIDFMRYRYVDIADSNVNNFAYALSSVINVPVLDTKPQH